MRLNAIMGVPDDRRIKISLNPRSTQVAYSYPGTTSFTALFQQPGIDWNVVWFGPDDGETGAAKIDAHAPTVNFLADADIYSKALQRVADNLSEVAAPVFNAPQAVAATTRDRVSDRLAGAPGLDVPRSIRLRPQSPKEIWDAVAAEALTYPVILRVAGTHSGLTMVKVEAPDDTALYPLPWGGEDVYATEFVDRREADGRFSKARLFCVGGTWFLRHWVTTDEWSVHVWNRSRDKADERAEIERLNSFETILRPKIAGTLAEIDRRLGLDYVGIDCFLDADGTITLYEANACMRVFTNPDPTTRRWDNVIRSGYRELVRLLSQPKRWKSSTMAES